MKSRRYKKGGSILDTLQGWGNTIKSKASDTWNSVTGKQEQEGISTTPTYVSPANTGTSYTTPTYSVSPNYGGKRRRKGKRTKRLRGGTKGYTSLTNVASHAASFSGATARPQVWVGGKKTTCRRSKKHRHSRSCKH